jgi:hypothetical protein
MVLKDHNTRGARHGNIKHVPRIRPIVPIRILKLPKAENHPPNRSMGVHLPHGWTGTWASYFLFYL